MKLLIIIIVIVLLLAYYKTPIKNKIIGIYNKLKTKIKK